MFIHSEVPDKVTSNKVRNCLIVFYLLSFPINKISRLQSIIFKVFVSWELNVKKKVLPIWHFLKVTLSNLGKSIRYLFFNTVSS